MNTAKYRSSGNSIEKVIPLTLFVLTFVVLFGATGCFDSSTENADKDGSEASKTSVKLPKNHTNNVNGVLHAPGNYTPFTSWCTACHGPALEGDLDSKAPSCNTCHGQVWTETAPPTAGGRTNNPPSNHTDEVSGFLHAVGKDTPYTNWCTACHGPALKGDLNLGAPSCTSCHDKLWTETTSPGSGGPTRNAPSNHTDNINGFLHAAGKDTPYTNWCTACHGADLTGATGPSCTACHAQVWAETALTGGGGARNLPSNHTEDVSGFLHAEGNDTPYTNWCTVCHGTALEGNLDLGAPSCTTCHGQIWTETTPPSGGGSSSNPPSNHTDNVFGFLHAAGKDTPYSNWCTVCHGLGLEGNLSTGAPSCTTCHGQIWTETAPPSGDGGSGNPPSNHTDDVNGFLHAPGRDTPYTSWCTACHGPALEGDVNIGAPSCTACHGQVWTETTPPSSGGRTGNAPSNHMDEVNGFFHAPGKDTPYTSWCTACHGADLTGDIGPSCTACHTQVWTETTPPSSGGRTSNAPSNHTDNVSGFLHAAGKETPYSGWCTVCHGVDLTGDMAPSCTACHAQVWTETAPPSGGSTGTPPSNHTDDVYGFLHAAGKQTPYTNWCTACHGAALEGNLDLGAPSCTACHGQVWTETTPPGGGSRSNPPSNHTDNVNSFLHAAGKDTPYTNWCTACHGAALEGNLELGAPSCIACHAQVWTEAPPSGGGSGGNPPTNHTDDVNGFLHAPGRDTPYTSWCTACHGPALEGDLNLGAPSCTACHGQLWTETTPPSSGGRTNNAPSNHTDNVSGFVHAPGKDTPYTSWCTACHGADLTGDIGPSCTACHAQAWSETSPPGSGGRTNNPPANHTDNVSGFLHAQGKDTPYTSWCSGCHGTDLTGDIGPSCTACHAQVWRETTPPSGANNLPSNHTDSEHGYLHAPGKNAPYTNLCTVCHGADLRGYLGPSCYTCHGREWNESGP